MVMFSKHNIKTITNNTTIHNYTIKLRGDGVYDLYVDKKWVVSKGSLEGLIEVLKEIVSE